MVSVATSTLRLDLRELSNIVKNYVPVSYDSYIRQLESYEFLDGTLGAFDIIACIFKIAAKDFKQLGERSQFHLTLTQAQLANRKVFSAVKDFFKMNKLDVVADPKPYSENDYHEMIKEYPWKGMTTDDYCETVVTVSCSAEAMKAMANINAVDLHKQKQIAGLFKAVLRESPGLVESYLKKDGVSPNSVGPLGKTPVYFIQRDLKIAELLHKFGADFTVRDDQSKTPLQIYEMFPNSPFVKFFKECIDKKRANEEKKQEEKQEKKEESSFKDKEIVQLKNVGHTNTRVAHSGSIEARVSAVALPIVQSFQEKPYFKF